MPQRLIQYARRKPTIAILALVTIISLVTTIVAATPLYGPPEVTTWAILAGTMADPAWWAGIPNLILIGSLSGYTVWAINKRCFKHQARASFLWFLVWFLSAVTRIVVIQYPWQLLWIPYLTVSLILAVIYLYLSAEHRRQNLGDCE